MSGLYVLREKGWFLGPEGFRGERRRDLSTALVSRSIISILSSYRNSGFHGFLYSSPF